MTDVGFQITFRHIKPSAGLREAAEAQVEKLSRARNGAMRCHVTVERPHDVPDAAFRVHVHLSEANRNTSEAACEAADPYYAIEQAFARIHRQRERWQGRHDAA